MLVIHYFLSGQEVTLIISFYELIWTNFLDTYDYEYFSSEDDNKEDRT